MSRGREMNGRRRGRPSKYDSPGAVVDIKPRRVEKLGKYKIPDGPTGKPERPCSRCKTPFFPTLRRRLLCAGCFATAEDVDVRAYPVSA